ncbi:MAG: glutathione S-transferase [Gammaproteobacteria bacterium]|nr:glutathione S-transferase [Gammaproteobacteria bacterium]MBT7370864.1 glutathione S-transferase [Gammaproteobacteria bacterium]
MTFIELSGLIPVTALYAGLHGLMAVVLANFVLYVRLRTGKVPAWQPDAALRVQANFIENVPLALVLLLVLEIQGMSEVALHACGGTLFVLRLLHAFGLGTYEGANYPRLIGAQGTFVLMAVMAIACIGSAL